MLRIDGEIKIISEGKADVSFFADSKKDVTLENIQKLVPDFELVPGSFVLTSYGDTAFLKSDGTWNWGIEKDEEV